MLPYCRDLLTENHDHLSSTEEEVMYIVLTFKTIFIQSYKCNVASICWLSYSNQPYKQWQWSSQTIAKKTKTNTQAPFHLFFTVNSEANSYLEVCPD